MAFHVCDRERQCLDRVLQIMREHGGQPNERLKLPALSFARDLIAKLFGHQAQVVSQRSKVVAGFQLDAMIEFAFGDRFNAFSDSFEAARLTFPLSSQEPGPERGKYESRD